MLKNVCYYLRYLFHNQFAVSQNTVVDYPWRPIPSPLTFYLFPKEFVKPVVPEGALRPTFGKDLGHLFRRIDMIFLSEVVFASQWDMGIQKR